MPVILVPLVSVLVGALATGIIKIVLDERQRRHDKRSALVAIVSEVDSICRLVRHQRYLEAAEEAVAANEAGEKRALMADIRADYFTVFNALAGRLGEQEPEHVRDIVRFYAYCKSAVDSIHPDGVLANAAEAEAGELLAAMVNLRALLGALLLLGEKIVKFPGKHISQFDPWPGEEPKSLAEARVAVTGGSKG